MSSQQVLIIPPRESVWWAFCFSLLLSIFTSPVVGICLCCCYRSRPAIRAVFYGAAFAMIIYGVSLFVVGVTTLNSYSMIYDDLAANYNNSKVFQKYAIDLGLFFNGTVSNSTFNANNKQAFIDFYVRYAYHLEVSGIGVAGFGLILTFIVCCCVKSASKEEAQSYPIQRE